MFLIVGLGNVGKKYIYNRHNLGFHIVDTIIKKYNFKKQKNKFESIIYKGNVSNHLILAIKPTTMMNLSGISVNKIKAYYKIPISKIFVFHDDIDLDLGKIKIKIGGGSGGHNGIKNIDKNIGKNYNRIRFGIDKPISKNNINEHVLGDFRKEENFFIMNKIAVIANNLKSIIENDTSKLFDALKDLRL